nr:LCP family protein [uncultured Agathobaculum sp.]
MKLFGGSGGRKQRNSRAKQISEEPARRAPAAAQQPDPAAPQAARTAPKPAGKKGAKVKKQLTRAQKRRRIIITIAVILVLVIGVAAAAAVFIRPPQANDPTIKDKENGDKVDVSGLLNSGTRIDDVVTFVIGAVDEDETRTDALMVATMDTNKKTVNIMNIPRDTMCNNSASGASRKINAAYAMGGIEQTKTEIERLMGFKPDYYVIVNFEGIAAIVDAIGGVDYEVPFRMEYDDPSQNLHIDLDAGMQHLDGEQVVEFLRWRHNNDYSVQYENGDEGRVENQQAFLKELANQVLKLSNVTKIPKIAEAVFNNVKTDLTAGNLLWMGMQALQIDNDDIQFFTLPGYGAMSTAGTSTAYSFFFPYYEETLKLVNQYFNPYEEPIETLDMVGGPESSSGSVDYSSSSDDNYVWGDTGDAYYEPSYEEPSYETPSYEEPSYEEPSYEEPSYEEPAGGGSSGGGDVSSGGSSGGESTGGGSSDGGTTGGGSSGGESTGGGTSGGESTGGGSSGGESAGGDTSAAIDPEA